MPSPREHAFLAVDLGAESGRVMLGRLSSGHLAVEEVHRFPNDPVTCGSSLHWDVARLWFEIRRGLEAVPKLRLDGIAVDAWGVDYALLGEGGMLLGNPHHYRDTRTAGMMEQVFSTVPQAEIYAATGIQFMPINTLYQLSAAKRQMPRLLSVAERLLTIPDLFHYWLTGNAVCEFTNATTTQMVDARTRNWAAGMLSRLDLPAHLLAPIVEPGTTIGTVLPSVSKTLAGTPVIAPASHDTGSAVAAVEARGSTAFLSSGTWSLLGIEVERPVLSDQARRLNFTNEGGVCGTTRLLKNVMGLWMVQGCRKRFAARGMPHDYAELMELAGREPAFQRFVDPNDGRFLSPDCTLEAINQFCRETGQSAPATAGAYVRTVLESLAFKYRHVLRDLETLIGHKVDAIRIIGGGSKNDLLNQFTADATGKRVIAGPVEATALGNLAIQMLAVGATASLAESRQIVAESFQSRIFEPRQTSYWDAQAEKFEEICEVSLA